MATPVKRLLSPKIISSLSPATTQFKNSQKLSPSNINQTRPTNFVQKLSFGTPGKRNLPSPYEPKKSFTAADIQFKVTNFDQNALLVNTPNKNNLLSEGILLRSDLKVLGKGSFGTVVQGVYKGKQVAVKIVKIRSRSSITINDINGLNLSHKNIVKLVDVIFNCNASYGIVIMEYLEHVQQLQSILDEKCTFISRKTIFNYALDICNGLKHCHENEILHLDIKPSNILVYQNSLCKICDFGNSSRIGKAVDVYEYQGTPAYTAPEILKGNYPTVKSDIYSLGILLWQMKYREKPYCDIDNVDVLIYKVVKFERRPQMPLNSILESYSNIFIKCWATDPLQRPEINWITEQVNYLNETSTQF